MLSNDKNNRAFGVDHVLVPEEEIREIVRKLGAQISRDYREKNLLLVSVLKGSVIFMSDLAREITVPCSLDFMATSSYGAGTKSTGVVKIVKDLDTDLSGWDVLIVEDILDSGRTLSYLMHLLSTRNPNSLRICTLLDKPDRRVIKTLVPDYVGKKVPDEFVVGYGLDCAEKYRNLPYIGVIETSEQSECKREGQSIE